MSQDLSSGPPSKKICTDNDITIDKVGSSIVNDENLCTNVLPDEILSTEASEDTKVGSTVDENLCTNVLPDEILSTEASEDTKVGSTVDDNLCTNVLTDEILSTEASEDTKEKVIFDNMEYSPAKESVSSVMNWVRSEPLGDFVRNTMLVGSGPTLTVMNLGSGEVITEIPTSGHVDSAVASAKDAKDTWNNLQPHIRARHLYSITREVQKQGKLLSMTESVSTGVTIRECKNPMLSDLVQSLYHFTGWAELSFPESKNYQSYGIVGVLLPEVATLTEIAQQVVPALSAGNCVIVSPAAPLPALLFAALCRTAGLPAGALSVVLGDPARQALLRNRSVAMISGSLMTQEACRNAVSNVIYPIPVSLSQVGRSAMLVFDNADLESAVSCVVDKAFFASGQSYDSVGRVLVQTSCYDKFIGRLRDKMSKLRVGDQLDNSVDVGAVLTQVKQNLEQTLQLNSHIETIQASSDLPTDGSYSTPKALLNVQPSSELWSDVLLGPVVLVTQFRTAKEAVSLVNHSKQGVGCSIWSEKNSLIMQLIKQLNVGSVWVNCHGIREVTRGSQYRNCTGAVQCGGLDLFKQYLTPSFSPRLSFGATAIDDKLVAQFGKSSESTVPSKDAVVDPEESVNKTIKMYIGGSLKRSATDSYRTIYSSSNTILGAVPSANKKDVRDAVEAAGKAFPGWSNKTGFNRSQILYFLAENICRRKEDFAEAIAQSTGRKYEDGIQEVDTSLQRLFMAAAWADKLGSSPWEQKDPVGVIGIVAPAQWPMLGLCSLLGPALAAGNTVVIVPSDKFPLVAADLCQVVSVSDVPGGVVNMLHGAQSPLALTLAQHHHVQSVWYFGYPEGCKVMLQEGIQNNKRVWCEEYDRRKWNSLAQGTGYSIYQHCYNNKVVVMPPGHSFAN